MIVVLPSCRGKMQHVHIAFSRLGRSFRRGMVTGDTSICVRTRLHPLRTVTSESDPIRLLPASFLRAADPNNYDTHTLQRKDVAIDTKTGKVLPSVESKNLTIQSCVLEGGTTYRVTWGDGVQSEYSESWLKDVLNRWTGGTRGDGSVERVLWTKMDEPMVRSSPSLRIPFRQALEPSGTSTALKALYKYGFVLVTDTIIDDNGEGIAALASALSGGSLKENASSSLLVNYMSGGIDLVLPDGTDGPLRTLYGSLWSTTASGQAHGASVADSAYTNDALPLHTDMTYQRDPPGLQIFTMAQPATSGGESIIADGFAMAEHLRSVDPLSFEVLASVPRTYRCIDTSTGWHLKATGPVISERNGSVVAIRHNDLDRLPDLPPATGLSEEETADFYDKLTSAHRKWDEVLNMDEFRLVLSLKSGDTLVVANQRCLHARHSFEASNAFPRTVMGCYVSQDDLDSRFRMEQLRVE